MGSLPILQGEGAHPDADACDFARFCSSLDFWSINDHAEASSPRRWRETKEAIRLVGRLEGMITDLVYEGKSMQGMIDLAQKGFFLKGSKVLYAHLGGAPALNGYGYAFRNG